MANWFENWFDSPYYHILYKHRNYKEAELVIDRLINYLSPAPQASFLDLACGQGRHSLYLTNEKQVGGLRSENGDNTLRVEKNTSNLQPPTYKVTGIDLSPQNIACALKRAADLPLGNKPDFFVKDMRHLQWQNTFDYILNLFTSFGYFENEADDYATIQAVSNALKPGGTFVLDFMNVNKVLSQLAVHEVKIIDDIEFEITKKVEKGFIVKQIRFSDKGKDYCFTERVKALTLEHFKNYFNASNLAIVDLKGNYNLEAYDEQNSWRLIIIAKKLQS